MVVRIIITNVGKRNNNNQKAVHWECSYVNVFAKTYSKLKPFYWFQTQRCSLWLFGEAGCYKQQLTDRPFLCGLGWAPSMTHDMSQLNSKVHKGGIAYTIPEMIQDGVSQ